jgi:hypothetical protein
MVRTEALPLLVLAVLLANLTLAPTPEGFGCT